MRTRRSRPGVGDAVSAQALVPLDKSAGRPRGRARGRCPCPEGRHPSLVLAPLRPGPPSLPPGKTSGRGACSGGQGPAPAPRPLAPTAPGSRRSGLRCAPSLRVPALLAAMAKAVPRGRGGSQRLGSLAAPSPFPFPLRSRLPFCRSQGLIVRRRVCACGRGAPALTQRARVAQRSSGRARGGRSPGTPRRKLGGRGRGAGRERAPE